MVVEGAVRSLRRVVSLQVSRDLSGDPSIDGSTGKGGVDRILGITGSLEANERGLTEGV